MYIYIARHAWAGHFGDPGWPDDSLRELETEGAERYARLVERLGEIGFAPEVVATSPFTRCRQTADIIAAHTKHAPEVVELDSLTPGSDFDAVVAWSQETGCDEICWVGHAPDVGFLAAALIGSRSANVRFAKGGVAAFRVHSDIGFDCSELYWLATAKLLGV